MSGFAQIEWLKIFAAKDGQCSLYPRRLNRSLVWFNQVIVNLGKAKDPRQSINLQFTLEGRTEGMDRVKAIHGVNTD